MNVKLLPAFPDHKFTLAPHRSTSVSLDGHGDNDTDWQTFSLEKLRFNIYKVSSERPEYMTGVQSTEPRERIPKVQKLQTMSDEVNAEVSKKERDAKHADMERERRERLKKLVDEQYKVYANDLALELAGWQKNSTKAPTKEVMMTAMNIHEQMRRRMDVLQAEASAQMEEELGRTRQECAQKDKIIICEREESAGKVEGFRRLFEHAWQIVDRSSASCPQNYLPFRANGQGQNQEHLGREWTRSISSSTSTYFPATSPDRSLPTLSESFHSTDYRNTKRKRGEDEGQTMPTGPSRHMIAKQSPDSSPRSANSSRGSWYLAERQV